MSLYDAFSGELVSCLDQQNIPFLDTRNIGELLASYVFSDIEMQYNFLMDVKNETKHIVRGIVDDPYVTYITTNKIFITWEAFCFFQKCLYNLTHYLLNSNIEIVESENLVLELLEKQPTYFFGYSPLEYSLKKEEALYGVKFAEVFAKISHGICSDDFESVEQFGNYLLSFLFLHVLPKDSWVKMITGIAPTVSKAQLQLIGVLCAVYIFVFNSMYIYIAEKISMESREQIKEEIEEYASEILVLLQQIDYKREQENKLDKMNFALEHDSKKITHLRDQMKILSETLGVPVHQEVMESYMDLLLSLQEQLLRNNRGIGHLKESMFEDMERIKAVQHEEELLRKAQIDDFLEQMHIVDGEYVLGESQDEIHTGYIISSAVAKRVLTEK